MCNDGNSQVAKTHAISLLPLVGAENPTRIEESNLGADGRLPHKQRAMPRARFSFRTQSAAEASRGPDAGFEFQAEPLLDLSNTPLDAFVLLDRTSSSLHQSPELSRCLSPNASKCSARVAVV